MATTRQEAETMERRLRPVYGQSKLFLSLLLLLALLIDAIENGQHKKAIQLVEKALKKTPDLNCAKVRKPASALKLCTRFPIHRH